MSAEADASTPLGIVATHDDGVRIEVVATHGGDTGIAIELRWQTESATLGWITQRRMELAPAAARQLGEILRAVTGAALPSPEAHAPRVVDLAEFRNRAG